MHGEGERERRRSGFDRLNLLCLVHDILVVQYMQLYVGNELDSSQLSFTVIYRPLDAVQTLFSSL
jgi:hypothetical protein